MTSSLDHLVVAGTDLSALVAWWSARSGLRPVTGGSHVGMGTKNALVGRGSAYLELVGPDPGQAEPDRPRPFGIDDLPDYSIRFVTFALGVADLDAGLAAVRAAGIEFGPAFPMSREKPDGSVLSWRLAMPVGHDGVMPFLIEWGERVEHPSSSLAPGGVIESVGGVHPDGERIADALAALDAPCTIEQGPTPGLRAVLQTPKGSIEL